MNIRRVSIIVASVAFAGCFAAKKASPVPSDVERGAAKFPGYTLAQLNEGKVLYESNCGTCHALKKPASLSEYDWRNIVPAMVEKVNKNGKVLDDNAEQLILRYVVTMSGL